MKGGEKDMKKGLIVLLALIITSAISLTGCQKKEQPATPPAAGAPAPESKAPPAGEPSPAGENAPPEKPAEGK